MKKSIATETIMKIFIMIAVILIASSFLLKVFNIDIFGFLKQKFGGLEIVDQAKALHVRMDVEQNQIWEVHLTDGEASQLWKDIFGEDNFNVHPTDETGDEKLFFYVPESSDKCLIFATNEESGGAPDLGRVYAVNQGAIIQTDCGSIMNCINAVGFDDKTTYTGREAYTRRADTERYKCSDNNCVRRAYAEGNTITCIRGGASYPGCYYIDETASDSNFTCIGNQIYSDCELGLGHSDTYNKVDRENKVISYTFRDTGTDWWGGCGDSIRSVNDKGSPDQKCNILVQEDHSYKIKYGLICTPDGIWKPCTKKAEGDQVTTGGSCEGTPTLRSCDEFDAGGYESYRNCISQIGCYWAGCSAYPDLLNETDCEQFLGNWLGCSGTPTPCSDISVDMCSDQDGCYYEPQNYMCKQSASVYKWCGEGIGC